MTKTWVTDGDYQLAASATAIALFDRICEKHGDSWSCSPGMSAMVLTSGINKEVVISIESGPKWEGCVSAEEKAWYMFFLLNQGSREFAAKGGQSDGINFSADEWGGSNKINISAVKRGEVLKVVREFFRGCAVLDDVMIRTLMLEACFTLTILLSGALCDLGIWERIPKVEHEEAVSKLDHSKSHLLFLQNQVPLFLIKALWQLLCEEPFDRYRQDRFNLDLYSIINTYLLKAIYPGVNYGTFSVFRAEREIKTRQTEADMSISAPTFAFPLLERNFPDESKYASQKGIRHEHLLHIFHGMLYPTEGDARHKKPPAPEIDPQDGSRDEPPPSGNWVMEWIPNATALLEKGFYFERAKATKDTCNMLCITFQSNTIRIPFLRVNRHMLYLLHGLVDWELFLEASKKDSNAKKDSPASSSTSNIDGPSSSSTSKKDGPASSIHVSTYVKFMARLMQNSDDLKLLRGKRIIELDIDDAGVIEFFQGLSARTTHMGIHPYFSQVFRDMNTFNNSKRRRLLSDFHRNYFSNPWTVISVMAATVLLLLTALQTFFTIYTYYHPRR